MTDEELEAIESRANAATPGRWRYGTNPKDCDARTFYAELFDNSGGEKLYFAVTEDAELCTAMCGNGPSSASNALFVSHARADVPALIAEVRRLRTEADKTVLDGLNVQALVARVEELEAEAAKSRRVFVWEFPWKDSNNVLRICWSKSLRFYLTMSDSCLELIDALTGDPFDCYDIHGVDKIGLAEQLIRELGFARDGDTFDRSRVTL